MFALTRAIHDAAHHGHLEFFDAWKFLAPDRHLRAQETVDLLCQFLEGGTGGAPATGTGRHAGHKRPHAQSLKNLIRDHNFLGTRLARRGRERHPDCVADAFLKQDGKRRRGRHRAFGAHAGFGQAQVQRIVAAPGQGAVDRHQILHAADLARQHDLVAIHAHGLRAPGRLDGGPDERLVHDRLGIPGLVTRAVLVHQTGQQLLVQAAPVNPDTHRLVPAHRGGYHLAELAVAFVPFADVARVDAVFGQSLGTGREVGQQAVAVVMEITDQRNVDAHAVKLVANMRHRLSRFRRIDGDTHHLRPSQGQLLDLDRGPDGVRRIGIGHGLHTHRRVTTHRHHTATPHNTRLARPAPGRGYYSLYWLD